MAKNAFAKRKRVARFQTMSNTISEFQDNDYVTNIINTMNLNLDLEHFKNFKTNSKVNSSAELNTDKKDVPIPRNEKKGNQLKKFGTNRTAPLMKKTKKFLQVLKHNQKIPKQRAHLASLPESQSKRNISSIHPGVLAPERIKCKQNVKKSCMNTSANQGSLYSCSNDGSSKLRTKQARASSGKANKFVDKRKLSSDEDSVHENFTKSKEDGMIDTLNLNKNRCSAKESKPISKKLKAPCKNIHEFSDDGILSSEEDLALESTTNTKEDRRINSLNFNKNKDAKHSKLVSKKSKAPCKSNDDSVKKNSYENEIHKSKDSNSILRKESKFDESYFRKNSLDCNFNAESDSSVDEFERFIQNTKKDLKKKHTTTKKTACKRKNISKKLPKKSQKTAVLSDSSDDTLSCSSFKSNKQVKVSCENKNKEIKAIISEESESDVMDGEIFSRDTSSESDSDPVNKSSNSKFIKSKNSEYLQSSQPSTSKCQNTVNDTYSVYNAAVFNKSAINDPEDMSNDRYSSASLNEPNLNSLSSSDEYVTVKKSDKCLPLFEPRLLSTQNNFSETDSSMANELPLTYPKCDRYSVITSPTPDSTKSSTHHVNVRNNSSNSINPIEVIDCESDSSQTTKSPVKNNESAVVTCQDMANLSPSHKNDCLSTPTQNSVADDSEESDIEVIDEITPRFFKKDMKSNQIDTNTDCLKDFNKDNRKNNATENIKIVQLKSNIQTKSVVDGVVESYSKVNDIDGKCGGCSKKFSKETNSKDKQIHTAVQLLKQELRHQSEIKKEDSDDEIILDTVILPAKILEEKLPNKPCSLSSLQLGNFVCKTDSPDVLIEDVKSLISEDIKINKPDCSHLCKNSTNMHATVCKPFVKSESLSSVEKTENTVIKTENIKLDELVCSSATENSIDKTDTKLIYSSHQQVSHDNVDLRYLVDLFKKEFSSYREIIRTEETVEARLKGLEARQAEKLSHIRSLIKMMVADEKYDKNDPTILELNKLCDTEQKKSDTTENNFSPNHLFKISSDDLKAQNMASIVPNLLCTNDLVHPKMEIKPELELSSEKTMELLKEICTECGKDAVAACEKCARVFYCSYECGKKSWDNGHLKVCGK